MDSSKLTVRELHQIRSKMWDASMQNHQKFMDAETGLFATQHMELRACPACGEDEPRPLFHKSGGTYVKCAPCRMVYLNPVFTQPALKDYYSQNHAVQSEIVELDGAFYRGLYEKGLRLVAEHVGNTKNVLDVGCSAGSFLDVAKHHGWSTHGIELNRIELEHARKKGHQVQAAAIEDAGFAVRMDAITLWDVFEHIPDGVAFLRRTRDLLADKGVVFLQCPQSSSLAARILQERCNAYDGLEHVNLYHRESLEIVAERSGFEVKAFQTVIPELGVVDNFLNYDDPYFGGTRNKETFLGLLTADQILEAGLGYKFQAVLSRV